MEYFPITADRRAAIKRPKALMQALAGENIRCHVGQIRTALFSYCIALLHPVLRNQCNIGCFFSRDLQVNLLLF